mmetsp:Transcript_28671/g.59225  ORF Transcript_28671/g.59225 Transcript_28671/m.59225 type:complete len:133 (+) Transcript_28671:335-733(+)
MSRLGLLRLGGSFSKVELLSGRSQLTDLNHCAGLPEALPGAALEREEVLSPSSERMDSARLPGGPGGGIFSAPDLPLGGARSVGGNPPGPESPLGRSRLSMILRLAVLRPSELSFGLGFTLSVKGISKSIGA